MQTPARMKCGLNRSRSSAVGPFILLPVQRATAPTTFNSGSASYHPYFVLEDSKSGEGLFLGFNYLGPWSMRIWNAGDYAARDGFLVGSQLELHMEPLAPGATFETPNSFLGRI